MPALPDSIHIHEYPISGLGYKRERSDHKLFCLVLPSSLPMHSIGREGSRHWEDEIHPPDGPEDLIHTLGESHSVGLYGSCGFIRSLSANHHQPLPCEVHTTNEHDHQAEIH